jgi:hypothetical protein
MKNVTLDRATVLQLDAIGTDSALDAAADCNGRALTFSAGAAESARFP